MTAPGEQRGARIDRFVVTSGVRSATHATVVQARDTDGSFVAIKLATTTTGSDLVDREARLLRALDAGASAGPRFVADGLADGRRYVASRWVRGTDVRTVAAELRAAGRPSRVAGLASRVTEAYVALQASSVLHGQVHPRHARVDRDGSVGLVDLSLAAGDGDRPPAARLALGFSSLSAPEHAAALLRGEDLELSAAAEQYSVAALLYLLVTGRLYARLRLERQLLAPDILASPTLQFAELGIAPWPQLEAILGRGLEKDPARRYDSIGELRRALASLALDAAATSPAPAPARSGDRAVRAPLADLLDAFRRDARAEHAIAGLPAPTCSINYGAAGVAFALTRLGRLTGDDGAFELAERWLSSAERAQTRRDAFDDGNELTPLTVGVVSPFHNASGLAAVRALLSDATRDEARQQAALDAFIAATGAPCTNLDLTLGRSSVLLVAALLHARSPASGPATSRLEAYGDELAAGILDDLDLTTMPYYGIAHGSAGVAYAALMWARARGVEPDPRVREILAALSAVAEPHERGARWPLTPSEQPAGARYWPGWCHGNAGYVFLWNLAQATYRDDRFGELADRAAWLTLTPAGVSSLCCGTAGQIYAALNHYRATDDGVWHDGARRLADRAATATVLAADPKTPLSLYKGHVGLALLALELERPERAAMPLFEFDPGA